MKIKNTFSIERAAEELRKELSSHIKVIVRSNIIDSNKKWLDIDKDTYVGLRVTFYADQPLVNTYVPNILARAFFGRWISLIFHYRSRTEFKNQIKQFLISEFYEQ
jgi:hypothetical protein